jgi:hypothetical protein
LGHAEALLKVYKVLLLVQRAFEEHKSRAITSTESHLYQELDPTAQGLPSHLIARTKTRKSLMRNLRDAGRKRKPRSSKSNTLMLCAAGKTESGLALQLKIARGLVRKSKRRNKQRNATGFFHIWNAGTMIRRLGK